MARSIVGAETRADRRAKLVEQYLLDNFRYIPNTASAMAPNSVEEFLLRRRVGHCEYFAAGMVVLMTALDTPARIAGGYYGGRLNPITGYYAMRREDAHAWTEVWDGTRWMTFDATPPDLRPGRSTSGLIKEYIALLGDSMTFMWDRYVLTFGLGDQIALAEDIIDWVRATAASLRAGVSANVDDVTSPSFVSWFALLILAGGVVVVFVRSRRPLFDELSRHLAKCGIEVGPAMTMEDALRELRREQPDAARALEPLIALYEEERFSARPDRARVSTVRRKLRELRT